MEIINCSPVPVTSGRDPPRRRPVPLLGCCGKDFSSDDKTVNPSFAAAAAPQGRLGKCRADYSRQMLSFSLGDITAISHFLTPVSADELLRPFRKSGRSGGNRIPGAASQSTDPPPLPLPPPELSFQENVMRVHNSSSSIVPKCQL